MIEQIEVLALGTHVLIDNDIPAIIRGVIIRSEHHISYDCVWWDERSRKSEWLAQDEIQVTDSQKTVIRFTR